NILLRSIGNLLCGCCFLSRAIGRLPATRDNLWLICLSGVKCCLIPWGRRVVCFWARFRRWGWRGETSSSHVGTSTGGPFKPGLGLSGSVHWLTKTEPHTLADALKSLKQGVSRRLIHSDPLKPKPGLNGSPIAEHFWQKRYYDFNIRNYAQFVEKLR